MSADPPNSETDHPAGGHKPTRDTRDDGAIATSLQRLREDYNTAQQKNDANHRQTLRWHVRTTIGVGLYTLLTVALVIIAKSTMDQSRDTEMRQLRAYVFPVDGWSADIGTEQPARASLTFKNSGQTPAYNLAVREYFTGKSYPLIDKLDTPGLQETRAVLGPGATFHVTMTAERALTPPELASVNAGHSAFYLYGDINFTDAFGHRWCTTFR